MNIKATYVRRKCLLQMMSVWRCGYSRPCSERSFLIFVIKLPQARVEVFTAVKIQVYISFRLWRRVVVRWDINVPTETLHYVTTPKTSAWGPPKFPWVPIALWAWNFVSEWKKSIDWGCLRRRFWIKYINVRKRSFNGLTSWEND